MNNKQLKKQFWGAQDEALQHTNSRNRLFFSKIIEHKKIEYSNDSHSKNKKTKCMAYFILCMFCIVLDPFNESFFDRTIPR